jgi:predicted ribosome quality control (RQC) complex YloA/Tae2 family protein
LEQYANLPELHVHESPSINVLLDDYYARTEWHSAVDVLRAPIRKILQTQRERCLRRAEILREEMNAAEEAAQYRLQAELLLAQQHKAQKGTDTIVLPNIYEDTGSGDVPLVTIPLDPRFDAVGNANRLFTKYRKLRRAVELVPAQMEQNSLELAIVNQLLTDLVLAETPAEVDLVKAEVQEAGYIRGKTLQDKKVRKGKGGKPAKKKPALPGGGVPLHMQTPDGFTVLVGKNSRQNEEVTFRQATSNDVWLHARGAAGAHVIIKAAGRNIPRNTIEQVAKVAAYYSEARGSTAVPVDYTLQRHVRHMKGGGPGMVIYEREHTLYAEPTSELS